MQPNHYGRTNIIAPLGSDEQNHDRHFKFDPHNRRWRTFVRGLSTHDNIEDRPSRLQDALCASHRTGTPVLSGVSMIDR